MRPVLRLTALLTLLIAASPAVSGEVMLRQEDLARAGPDLWIARGLSLPAPDDSLPLVGEQVPRGAATLLRRAGATGGINGFAGILYDNRDREHSTLPATAYPRLARLRYDPETLEPNADYGLAGAFLFPAVVFGNSSTAVTAGPFARSLPRLAMSTPDAARRAAMLYLNNALYAYPEHRDFDAVDLYPANWPYTIVSQGSSGSDRPFLLAIAATLAAFPEDTFDALRAARLVAPTLQMILRRNMAGVRTREAYFTAAAHPVALNGGDVSAGRMIAQAAAMRPEDIPPLVQLRVEAETFREQAGLAGLSERHFDTPAAIARIWRGFEGRHEMELRAGTGEDPFGRAFGYRWVLLRGDPERVEITPLSQSGNRVRLRLDWHEAYPERAVIEGAPGERLTSRIDIAVFAEAGDVISAPSFVSVSFPTHQRRVYGPDGPEGPVLRQIDYDAIGRDTPYDPLLHWSAPWTDIARTTPDGIVRGWTRRHADGREEEIAAGLAGYDLDRSDPARPVLAPVAEAAAETPTGTD